MTKKYQNTTIDTNSLAVPEQVSIAMEHIAADMPSGCSPWPSGPGCR